MSSKSSPFDDKTKFKKQDSKKKLRNTRSRSISSNKRYRDKRRNRGSSKNRSRSRDRDSYRKNNEIKISKPSRWSDVPPTQPTDIQKTSNIDNSNFTKSHDSLYKEISPILSNNQIILQNNQDSFIPQNFSNNHNSIVESNKFKRKVYFPKQVGVNYVGLLIGPKGAYQKRLELQTNCKILIRGKGTQKEGVLPQPDDEEQQHVLIVGNSEENVIKAELLVQRVLYSDDQTRNKIKEEQLRVAQEIRTDQYSGVDNLAQIEDHLMTPYGPPDKNARIIPVPNDCVGLIIGKNGETIRRLHREAGCKIQIAKAPIPNTEVRNVFIEGPPEKYENAKKLIEDIVAEQQLMKINFSALGEQNPFTGPQSPLKVLNKYIGLIIGKNGETVRNLHQKTGCFIYIPKESKEGEDFRIVELSGTEENIKECKKEIETLIDNANKVTEALYQSIDLNYLSRQSSQTIPQIDMSNNHNNPSVQMYSNNNLNNFNNTNIVINQIQPQINSNPYNLKNYPVNNINAMKARLNFPGNQFNNSFFPHNMPIYPYGMNNININSFNVPFQTGIPIPVIQHMSINNFPTTNFVNFSNNSNHNQNNLQTFPINNNPSSSAKTEHNLESNNFEDMKITKSNTSLSENNKKKKDDLSKKGLNSILNYIYGGQVK